MRRRVLSAWMIGAFLAATAAAMYPSCTARAQTSTRTPTVTATPIPTGTPAPTGTPTIATAIPWPTFVPEPPTDPETSVRVGAGPFAFHVDLGDWIAKLLRGMGKAIGVDAVASFGGEIAGWMLVNPDLTHDSGQMANVQRMTDALRLAALSLVIVLFIASVYRLWLGGAEAPVAALGRLVAVLVALGFYKPLVGLLVGASNAVTGGVLHAGVNVKPPAIAEILAAIPTTNPLWSLAGVIALAFLFVLGVVRILGFAFLLVAYVAGPVMLPLALVPETAGYTALWAKHGAKLLFWSVLWALEFRLFDALKEGLYLPDRSIGHALLAPFAALAMLVVMFRTPLMLHSGSFEQTARGAVRVVRVAAGAATAAFSGGTTTVGTGAAARTGSSTAPIATHPATNHPAQPLGGAVASAGNATTQTVRLPVLRGDGG